MYNTEGLFLLFWHGLIGVHSTKQSLFSRVDDSEPCRLLHSGMRLLGLRSCWIVFIHIVKGLPGGLQFFKGKAVKVFLASVSSSIQAMWPYREKRYAWTMAERCGCLVVCLTSLFRTCVVPFDSYQLSQTLLIENILILSTSLLVTGQHSEEVG